MRNFPGAPARIRRHAQLSGGDLMERRPPNFFSGPYIDRRAPTREDPQWIAAARADPATRYLVGQGSAQLLQAPREQRAQPERALRSTKATKTTTSSKYRRMSTLRLFRRRRRFFFLRFRLRFLSLGFLLLWFGFWLFLFRLFLFR